MRQFILQLPTHETYSPSPKEVEQLHNLAYSIARLNADEDNREDPLLRIPVYVDLFIPGGFRFTFANSLLIMVWLKHSGIYIGNILVIEDI